MTVFPVQEYKHKENVQFCNYMHIVQYLQKEHYELYENLVSKRTMAQYFVGFQSTGVVCSFNCSRKSNTDRSDCVFSKRLHDLISHGYVECGVCKPLSSNCPEDLRDYLDSIQTESFPTKSPESIPPRATAWVKEVHQTDLLKYICSKRSNGVLQNTSPSSDKHYPSALTCCRYWTPVGSMVAVFSKSGLCLLEFGDRRMLESELLALQRRHKAVFTFKPTILCAQLGDELSEYFRGTRKTFSIPLDQKGSEFQQSVWEVLKQIPYGTTTSYKRQAIVLGKPEATRAVANANGNNSIAIIVPCHRVIGESGDLVGYGGGIERKQFLLQLESLHREEQDGLELEQNAKKKSKTQTTLNFTPIGIAKKNTS